jgi:hypothetical protein
MTNNKQQTAVDWLIEQFYNNEGMLTTKKLLKAKEIESRQLQAYAEFCVTCDRNKLPLLDFESWLKLPSKEDSAEAALDDYNRMEEEWEMENYNQMKEEQSE